MANPGTRSLKQREWAVDVIVVPKAGVNDPEGEAILGGLIDLGYSTVERVQAGRRFRITLRASEANEARKIVKDMAEQLLANPVIQSFWVDSVEGIDDSEKSTN